MVMNIAADEMGGVRETLNRKEADLTYALRKRDGIGYLVDFVQYLC